MATNPSKNDERLFQKLVKLEGRRDYHAWRLRDVERQMSEARKKLAAERGVGFIRPESITAEIVERMKKELEAQA